MKTIFKNRILAGALMLASLFAAASCEDNEMGLKVTPETPYADKTLYEVLNGQEDLTSFMEVLNACGAHCADSLFNGSRVYTVWAPVNEAMADIKDELLQKIADGQREEVFKTFIKAHVANHLRPANGLLEEGNRVMMLNDKKTNFEGSYGEGYTFDGKQVVAANIRAWNGVLHKLNSAAEYKYNIWEFFALSSEPVEGGYRFDSVANYLYSFNDSIFDEYSSILGPVVNGEQTYLDSVWNIQNKWLNVYGGIGNLDLEDSLYTVYIQTNEAWNEIVTMAESNFRYNYSEIVPTSLDSADIDSLFNYYPRFNLIKYLTFSEGERKYIESAHPDSMTPAYRDYPRPVFPKSQLENEHVVFTKEMSNGVFKLVDKFPYTPLELWLDTIKLEAEDNEMRVECLSQNAGNQLATESMKNSEDSLLKDSEISGSFYFQSTSTDETYVHYRIADVLSTKYRIAMIVVPKHITNPRVKPEELMPTYFNVEITQAGQGTVYSYAVANKNNKLFNDPTRLDTLYLCDDAGEPAVIEFPSCEYYKMYGNTNYSTTMKISSINPGRAVKEKDYSIRLDAILLIPVIEEEE